MNRRLVLYWVLFIVYVICMILSLFQGIYLGTACFAILLIKICMDLYDKYKEK
ncbi:MAG: hypothetical protein RR690_01000 [Longicatena sp.]